MLKQLVCAVLALVLPLSVSAQPDSPEKAEALANSAMAERLAAYAQMAIAGKPSVRDDDFRQSAALLQAAIKLNPQEPRYPRMLAEAQLQLRDPDAALESLRAYSRLASDDLVVQVQIIDLYSAKMESADAKLNYLRGLLDKGLADEVKSRIALRVARLLSERGEQSEATELVNRALKLDPLHSEALAFKLSLTHGTATPAQRAEILVQMIRANPREPEVMIQLANLLADNGLNLEATSWYLQGITVRSRMGLAPNVNTFVDYASTQLLAEQTRFANQTVESLLAGLPTNPEALLLKLLIDKRSSDPETLKETLATATTAMLENVYQAHRELMGGDSPTTKPSGEFKERLPDLMAMVNKCRQLNDPAAVDLLAQDLIDLAWLEIYFAQQPQTAAPLIEALTALLPPDNLTVPRLTGWSYLIAGQKDEAKVKLSAIADRDALSALGVLRINAAEGAELDATKTHAAQLLRDYGVGVLGANLLDGVREFGVAVSPSDAASELRAELEKLPKQWLEILDKPQDYYTVKAGCEKIPHGYDEPMIAVVEIANTGPFDLAVGADGVIRPDLWFDLQARAGTITNIANAAYDRLAKRFVLKRGESMKQTMRLDQYPRLLPALESDPIRAMQLYFSVLTNPTPTPGGGIAPGPAGYRASLRSVVERQGMPIGKPETQQQLISQLVTGKSDEKMRALSVLSVLAMAWSSEEAPEQARASARRLIEAVDDLRGDHLVAVRGWAMVRAAMIRSAEPRATGIKQMAAAPEWLIRLLGAMICQSLPLEQSEPILTSLLEDEDPIVRDYARASIEVARRAATQPAATQPTTQPAGDSQ